MTENILKVKNLVVGREDSAEPILQGLNLEVKSGEVHAIMGPNGSGKSTLAQVLAGKAGYEVLKGEVEYQGKNLLELSVDERARAGLFLAFQYPVEIPGLSAMVFLRHAVNSKRQALGQPALSPLDFLKYLRQKTALLNISDDFLKRSVNDGFSGGEKKRFEALQILLLEPELIVLDETDSGLDIDAMKTVAAAINSLKNGQRSFIIITHYQRLLNYLTPDVVWVLAQGQMVARGDSRLVETLEREGYQSIIKADRQVKAMQPDANHQSASAKTSPKSHAV